ncbi:MAG: UvrD-helicase domain-containing protein [Clostridia bacterium]|nr:UvrD-helicase domain-containing protein [Clostridia bacterium]
MNLDHLNDKQREAVLQTEGPVLILAGAGSGKTSTMTHRIAYLIEQGVSPYEILAVTFTNKAAGEMRDRVASLIGNCDRMWILTFHSMCLRILRKHGDKLGYDKNFVIYDTTDQKTLMKSILKEHQVDEKKMNANFFLSIISKNKENAVSPQSFYMAHKGDGKSELVAKVYDEYEKALKKNNAMDFDDLLLNTHKLFKADESVVLEYQDRFKYIMVDEYQDTNHLQYELIHALAEKSQNLCVVGDDDQCIYEWRGADIRNILDFEKDFKNAKIIKLEQNYRSYGNILKGAHSVIKHNRGRKGKELWTDKENGELIKYRISDSEIEEADYIATCIGIYHSKGYSYKDMAILYRMNAQSRALEMGLARKDIPYRVLAGLRYYDRKEVKDLLAYMRLIVNPADDLSLKRIINVPKRGVGDKTVEKCQALAMVEGKSLYEILDRVDVQNGLPVKACAGVKEVMEVLNICRQEKDNLRVSDIYDTLLEKTGYLVAFTGENTVEAESRIENLMEFKTVIAEFERDSETGSLEEFMENISLMSDIDNHNSDEDAVVLMTLHSAKGLEFPIVFMPGMEEGIFPGMRSFESPEGLEEERRLCYVGMTRAKEKLIMTTARSRMIFGRTEYSRPSCFMNEIDKKLLEGDMPYVAKPRSLGVDTGSFDGFGGNEVHMPFDPLKQAENMLKQRKADHEEFNVGDRVSHKKFGPGTVKKLDGRVIVIDFEEYGEKKLAVEVAPLKKIYE